MEGAGCDGDLLRGGPEPVRPRGLGAGVRPRGQRLGVAAAAPGRLGGERGGPAPRPGAARGPGPWWPCSGGSAGPWPRRTPGAFRFGLRLLALDGTKWNVPDTPANARAFGRPAGGRGTSAWPQVQVVALSECGTHAVCDAGVWGHAHSERARRPPAALGRPGRSADLGPGPAQLRPGDGHAGTGGAPAGARPGRRAPGGGGAPARRDRVVRPRPGESRRRRAGRAGRGAPGQLHAGGPRAAGPPGAPPAAHSPLDPRRAPAAALVRAYHARWEAEVAFDEPETHQRPPGPCAADPGRGAPGGLRPAAGPLRRPRRHGRGGRPGPAPCPRAAELPGHPAPPAPGAAGVPSHRPRRPPAPLPPAPGRRGPACWRRASTGATPGWSSARCPTSGSKAPTTGAGRSPPGPSTMPSSSLSKRYWG